MGTLVLFLMLDESFQPFNIEYSVSLGHVIQNNLYCSKKVPKSVVATRVVMVRFNLSVVPSAGFPFP